MGLKHIISKRNQTKNYILYNFFNVKFPEKNKGHRDKGHWLLGAGIRGKD